MLLKVVTVAIFAAVVGPFGAQAQSLAQIGGPAETPPGGYKGDQYVDSRGCVFLRAGFSGQARWVPRVNRDHKVLCGYPPTFGAKPVIEVATAADMAPAPAPVMAAQPAPVVVPAVRAPGAPIPTVASAMMPEARVVVPVLATPVQQPAPYVDRAPQRGYEAAATGPAQGKIGCYTSAPVAEVVRLRNGGTAVVCTRGDGTTAGWRSPIYPAGAGVGAALRDPVVVTRGDTARGAEVAVQDYADAAPVVPKGYRLAWSDDRLNPNRARGTAAGQVAQNQIWTQDVPSELVADVAKAKAKKRKAGGQVTVSSKNAPTEAVQAPRAAASGVWVQVGTFGVPENASGAAQRLAALGLPVAKGKLTKGGKALQIVLAGPFGSGADAQAALRMARQAGFGDAFLR